MQLRDESGHRWERSVYLDRTARTVAVPLTDFRPLDPGQAPSPNLEQVRSLLFVVDTTNASGGMTATIELTNVQFER